MLARFDPHWQMRTTLRPGPEWRRVPEKGVIRNPDDAIFS